MNWVELNFRFILFCGIFSYQVHAANRATDAAKHGKMCANLFSRWSLGRFQGSPIDLHLSPKGETFAPYVHIDGFSDLELNIDKNSPIKEISTLIAGSSGDPKAIEHKIKSHFEGNSSKPLLLSTLLPKHIQHLINFGMYCDGFANANCLNAALSWHDSKPHKMTGLREFNDALKGYQKVRSKEELAFGDLVVVRLPLTRFHLHAAIYIDDKFVWHKPSASGRDLWMFSTWDQMLKFYNRVPRYVEFYRKPNP